MPRRTYAGWVAAPFLVLCAACGQWSGAPVKTVEPAAIPLGPGRTVTVARLAEDAGAPAVDAWGDTVVVAWIEASGDGTPVTVKSATSRDAGASFDAPVMVGMIPVGHDVAPGALRAEVGVGAAAPGTQIGASQVWVRVSAAHAPATRAWRSRDGGRGYVEIDSREMPAETVFPERWEPMASETAVAPGTLAVAASGTRRTAGIQQVPIPAAAVGDPVATVDDHGALALLWRERAGAGRISLVVRRAWVDWNITGGAAPGFDAAYTLATVAESPRRPALTRVPGGIVVAWIDPEAEESPGVFARRLGLDMTCTRESTLAPR